MGPWRVGGGLGNMLASMALVLLLLAPLVVAADASASGPTADGAAPPPSNAPTLSGAVIIDDGAALGLVGYTGWLGVWTPASNGTQIYTSQFYLIFFNLRTTGFPLTIVVRQNGGFVSNSSIFLSPVSESAVTINLPTHTSWTATSLNFSGTPAWHGQAATPVSFLPPSVASVGGLDLLALVLVSFMVLVGSAAFAVAAWAMRRAVWAPRFSLLVWGHVLLALLAALVFLDYIQIDQAFAGWSPLVYPWATFPLFFLSALWRFNRAPQVEILQGVAPPSGEFAYRRTKVRVGPLPDGRVVPVGESWGDFWARFWLHYGDPIWDGSPENMPPFLAPVETMVSPTASPRAALKAAKMRRKFPLTTHPLFRFQVTNPQADDVAYIAHAKTSEPLKFAYPYLSFHRVVDVPAVYQPSPSGPVMVRAPTKKRKLSWPHYVDPPSHFNANILEDKHFAFGAVVWAEFSTIKDLSRVVSKLGTELAVLKAHIHNLTEDKKYADLRTHYSVVDRASSGISEEESARAVGDMDDVVRGSPSEGGEG